MERKSNASDNSRKTSRKQLDAWEQVYSSYEMDDWMDMTVLESLGDWEEPAEPKKTDGKKKQPSQPEETEDWEKLLDMDGLGDWTEFAEPKKTSEKKRQPSQPEEPVQKKHSSRYAERSVRPERQEPSREEQTEPKQKSIGGVRILGMVVVVILSVVATIMTMEFVFHHVGRPKQTEINSAESFSLTQRLEQNTQKREEALLSNLKKPEDTPLQTEEAAQEETTAPTEAPVVHQHYEIPADAKVAPKPNPDCFGVSSDPEVLQKVLEDAAWLLGDDPVYFKPDGQRFEKEDQVRWYLDESMLAITWKEVHDESVYTFSEIKVQDPSQFRRHLAEGVYGSSQQYMTTEMAKDVNAVVASAGDFYRFRNFGAVVYEGIARRVEGTYAETCYIDKSGNMHFTYGGDVLTVQDVQKFVDEHDISFSLAFGPVLVDNGKEVEHSWYGVGEITEGYARAALCQMAELHYIVVTANTQENYQQIPTVATFRKNIMATGCTHAYCLDGGQTASIVMNNELINRPVYGQQRKISDIIYFATAVPEDMEENG